MALFAAPVSAEVVALSGFRAAGTPVLDRGHVYEPWGVLRFFVRDPNGKVLNILSHA